MPEKTSEILIISDLHLSPERPEIIELFIKFINDRAMQAMALYILGDFFEYWIGDDDPANELDSVFKTLQQLHENKVPVFFMHGNRDFLAGERFAKRSRCQLIKDPHKVSFFGVPVLLMHGDSLCTDDVKYQAFKQLVRGTEWQSEFLAKPIQERRAIVEGLRDTSKTETQEKAEDIMDVNDDAVRQTLLDNQVRYLIHGHTHRPNIHTVYFKDYSSTRIVLGDWYDHGSVLSIKSPRHSGQLAFDLQSFP